MLIQTFYLVNICLMLFISCFSQVKLGVDRFFSDGLTEKIKGKKIAIYTNHTGLNSQFISTIELFQLNEKGQYTITAILAPEHGLEGLARAGEKLDSKKEKTIPVFSLYGKTRRPTENMLKDVDVVICDIQDIGARSYTFATTMFYIMEECSKFHKKVIVLDRPNPLGNIIDGPMLSEKYRSFIGYINVPYCHGMTIGELAVFFNEEYSIKCDLEIVRMKNYRRSMRFQDTGLKWIPTSPQIPEADTPFFYASTGIIGELEMVNIGIGYTLPFKVIGANWIDAKVFAARLNDQGLQGVYFIPFHYKPFFGSYKGLDCGGVMIQITDYEKYRPIAVQYLILGILKSLYPKQVMDKLNQLSRQKKEMFNKANGGDEILNILIKEKYPAWKLIEYQHKEQKEFYKKRSKYLFPEYS